MGDSHRGGVICEDYDATGVMVPKSMLIIFVIRSGVLPRAGRLARPGELDDGYVVDVPWVSRGKVVEVGAAHRVVCNQRGSPVQRASDGSM